MHLLPYNFNLLRGLQPPSWVLKTPLLAELFGAGFTKAPHSEVNPCSLLLLNSIKTIGVSRTMSCAFRGSLKFIGQWNVVGRTQLTFKVCTKLRVIPSGWRIPIKISGTGQVDYGEGQFLQV